MISMQFSQTGPLKGSFRIPIVLHSRQGFPGELGQGPFSPPARIVQPGVRVGVGRHHGDAPVRRLGRAAQGPRNDTGSHVYTILLIFPRFHGGYRKSE